MLVLNKGEYTGRVINKFHLDGSIISTTYSTKESNSDWHYHQNLHMCFVFQGGKAETRKSTSYTQKNGTLFFYHSGEKHRWISPSSLSKSANIEISHDFLKKYGLSELDVKNAIQSEIDAKLLILKMQKEMLVNDINSSSTINTLLLELITKADYLGKKDVPNWIVILTELLNDNWNKSISLNEISKVVGVHPVTISKYFRKYFSCTLGEYQRKLKIAHGCELIKDLKMSLTEIAFHCGFTDQSHFTRNFKEMTGFLPKHFRNF